jgi:Fic family protein
MNLKQFTKNAPGRLVQAFEGGSTFHAFVPDPLPPKLELTPELVYVLSGADRALGELAGLGRNLTNPQLFIRPFIRREAVLSSRIEGTQTELAELYAFEAGQLSFPGFNDQRLMGDAQEVLNYVQALEYGLERLQTFPFSLRLIRDIHARLMSGVRGERATPGQFRTRQNFIGSRGNAIAQARFVPPPVAELQETLRAFELYLNTTERVPPLIRLALIHYQFEAIHPFFDGNGRMGRLLISLLLVHWKLLPLPLLYLSAYFEKQRDTYYDLLLAVSQRGAWQEWLHFFLQGVTEQADDANRRATQLQALRSQWEEVLKQSNLNIKFFGLLDMLFRIPFITANEVSSHFAVSHKTAMRTLRQLVDGGILAEGSRMLPGNQITFVAVPILLLFDEP